MAEPQVIVQTKLDDAIARKQVNELAQFIQKSLGTAMRDAGQSLQGAGLVRQLDQMQAALVRTGRAATGSEAAIIRLTRQAKLLGDSLERATSRANFQRGLREQKDAALEAAQAQRALALEAEQSARGTKGAAQAAVELAKADKLVAEASIARERALVAEAKAETTQAQAQARHLEAVQRLAIEEKKLAETKVTLAKAQVEAARGSDLAEDAARDLAEAERRLAVTSNAAEKQTEEFAQANERLAQALEREKNVLSAAGTNIGKFQANLKQANQRQATFTQEAAKGTDSLGFLTGAITKASAALFFVDQAIQTVTRTLGGLYDQARQGAVVEQTTLSFQRFAEEVVQIPTLLDDARRAARGTISDFTLMSETLTLVSGLGPELSAAFSVALTSANEMGPSLIEIARAAQILNPALGDVDFFLKSLSIGIKRNERRWIDNLGIVISAREAYERFAEANNKSVLALTAEEKQLATLNEVQRVGAKLIEQLGGATESQVDAYAQLETRIENLKNEGRKAINDFFLPLVQLLAGPVPTALQQTIDRVRALRDELALGLSPTQGVEQLLREQTIFLDQWNEEFEGLAQGSIAARESIEAFYRQAAITAGEATSTTEEYVAVLEELRQKDFSGQIFTDEEIERTVIENLAARSQSVEEFTEAVERAVGSSADLRGALADVGIEIPFISRPGTVEGLYQQYINLIKAQREAAAAQSESEQAALELARSQEEVANKINQVAQSIRGPMLKAFTDLAAAQQEFDVASALGEGVEEAENKVITAANNIRDVWSDMLVQMFDESRQASELGALQFQRALGIIDQATFDSSLNFLAVRDASQALFVQLADPALASFANDANNVAFAAAAIGAGMVPLVDETGRLRDVNVVAAEAIALVADGLNVQELAILQNFLAEQQLVEVTEDVAEAQFDLREALVANLVALLQNEGAQGEWVASLIQASAEAGATTDQVFALARASGVLSEQQLVSAGNTTLLAREQFRLAQAVASGEVAADRAAGQLLAYARSLGIATNETITLGQATREVFGGAFQSALSGIGQGLSGGGGAASQIKEAQSNFRDLFIQIASGNLDLAEGEDLLADFNSRLFDLSAGADASVEQLIALKLASGELSEEQAQLAFNQAAAIRGIEAIADAYVSGSLTAEQATAAVSTLQQQIAAGEAPDLGEFGIDLAALASAESALQDVATASGGAAQKIETWRDTLLSAATAEGASVTSLLAIARATGNFTEAQLQAILVASGVETAINNMDKAAADFDAEAAIEQLGNLETALLKLTPDELAQFLDLSFDLNLSPEELTAAINSFVSAAASGEPITVPVAINTVLDEEKSQTDFGGLFGDPNGPQLTAGEVTITADATEAQADVDAVQAALTATEEGSPYESEIEVDNEVALGNIEEVETNLGALLDDSPYVTVVEADTEAANTLLQEFLDSIPDSVSIDVNLNIPNVDLPGNAAGGGSRGSGDDDEGPGYARGGYTGTTGGRVHPREFVFSEPAVDNIGVNTLEQMHTIALQKPGANFSDIMREILTGGISNESTNLQTSTVIDMSQIQNVLNLEGVRLTEPTRAALQQARKPPYEMSTRF